MSLKLRQPAILTAAVAVWMGAVGFGMTVLWRYSATPGDAATPPVNWPRGLPVQPQKGRAMLVMFAHPHCPCSKASVEELAIVMARTQDSHASSHSSSHTRKLDAHVFFYAPATADSTWVRTSLWRNAASIPGVQAFRDPGASVARSLGAFTSGQTLLYSSAGKLLFNGGITSSRGHSGDSSGRQAILGLVHEGGRAASVTPPSVTPVFGCSLRGE